MKNEEYYKKIDESFKTQNIPHHKEITIEKPEDYIEKSLYGSDKIVYTTNHKKANYVNHLKDNDEIFDKLIFYGIPFLCSLVKSDLFKMGVTALVNRMLKPNTDRNVALRLAPPKKVILKGVPSKKVILRETSSEKVILQKIKSKEDSHKENSSK